ncbi:RING-H2 finger protein ATL2 [Senna tora]|uniref:RING-type E3 ubiquitin transferase n=1 Tax=Senna tora TaxID=362788 RepID=A0A834X3Y2_9FABA|nr:RING-H2 finger protein ATL2 [Senna tora]
MDPKQGRNLNLYEGKAYSLTRNILLTAILVLLFLIILMICLHFYSRWYLRRARLRLRRRARFVFYVDSDDSDLPSRGLDASIIHSLPVFLYSSNTHPHSECAVCLSEFEDNESGRVLPKCKHAFHVECIDMWFHSHSTCPLCRSLVEPVGQPGSEVVIDVCKPGPSSDGGEDQEENRTGPTLYNTSSSSIGVRRMASLVGVNVEEPKSRSFGREMNGSSCGSPSNQLSFRSPRSQYASHVIQTSHPRQVPLRCEDIGDVRIHYDHLRVGPPWASQEGRLLGWVRGVLRLSDELAALEDQGARAVCDRAAAGCDDAVLVVEWLPDDESAVLEDGVGVTEDEVDGAGDEAVTVELPVGLGVQGLDTIFVVEGTGESGEGGAISNNCDKRHGFIDDHFLIVYTSLHVDDEGLRVPLRNQLKSLRQCFELPRSILSHNYIRSDSRRSSRTGSGSGSRRGNGSGTTRTTSHGEFEQATVVAVAHPRRYSVGVLSTGVAVISSCGGCDGGGGADPEAEGLGEIGDAGDDVQSVHTELHGGVEDFSHGLGGVGVGVLEAVQAGALVGDGGGEPDLEVVGVVTELGEGEGVEAFHGLPDVVDGVVQHLMADVHGLLRHVVLRQLIVEGGVVDEFPELLARGVECCFDQIFHFAAVVRCLGQGSHAGFFVFRGIAEHFHVPLGG